jgi:alkylation response protein AidB-like acyl-CoA dehydrogenase
MNMDSMIVEQQVLPEDMLKRFAERVGTYDRENRFFQEDFDDLKRAGYLTINVPKEMGGRGFTLAEVCREQRRLAYYAPATALGINMHLYWIGIAADLWRAGDRSLEWLLREAAAGEVFAAGHAERGNDIPVLLSTSVAKKVDGGFSFTGRKMFGSLAPVWTRYGMHGVWADAPGGPQVVHGFLPRNAKGYRIVETWDTLGMRATRSDDVLLEGAVVPDKYIVRSLPAGGADAFVVAVFAWALMGFANIYYGMAERARDLVLPGIKAKSSMGLTRSMAYHPGIQQGVADLIMLLDPIGPHLEQVAQEWSTGVDHGAAWPASSRPRSMPWRRAGRSSIWRWNSPAARACSSRASWSGCSATPAAAAFIRRTLSWPTRSSARLRWGSGWTNSPAGGNRGADTR